MVELEEVDDAVEVEPGITQQIAEAVGIATGAFEAMATGLKAIKALVDSAKSVPQGQVDETISLLKQKVTLARDANSTLREIAADLRDENTRLKRQAEDFAGYVHIETPLGSHVYRSPDGYEPLHYVCPICKEQGFKSFLNGNARIKTCGLNPKHGDGGFKFEPVSEAEARARERERQKWKNRTR